MLCILETEGAFVLVGPRVRNLCFCAWMTMCRRQYVPYYIVIKYQSSTSGACELTSRQATVARLLEPPIKATPCRICGDLRLLALRTLRPCSPLGTVRMSITSTGLSTGCLEPARIRAR